MPFLLLVLSVKIFCSHVLFKTILLTFPRTQEDPPSQAGLCARASSCAMFFTCFKGCLPFFLKGFYYFMDISWSARENAPRPHARAHEQKKAQDLAASLQPTGGSDPGGHGVA